MQMQAQITPERIRTFVMPAAGHVNNWLPDRDREQKGAIIATVNEEDMELKRKELEIQILKDKTAKRDEIVGLRKQLEEINFYSGLTPEEKRWHDKKKSLRQGSRPISQGKNLPGGKRTGTHRHQTAAGL